VGDYEPGIFLSVLFPQDGETFADVARTVSSYLEWVPADSPRSGYWVHRGVFWAVIVHDYDNPERSCVIALARDPSNQAWEYMRTHRAPPSSEGSGGTHTIHKADEEYKQGNKVAMGHNGPL
jgi:hypothetical protein